MDRTPARVPRLPLLACAAALTGATCVAELSPPAAERIGALPAAPPHPGGVAPPEAEVELGRLLFWDPILSGDRDVACATCHHPAFGYGDGRALSVGVGGRGLGPDRVAGPATPGVVPRNSPTVVNAAYNGMLAGQRTTDPLEAPMFWDNRARGLEGQALEPLRSDVEMRGDAYPADQAVPAVLARLADIPAYVERFEEVFGPDGITEANLARAIASFERTLVAPSTSFDRYVEGDTGALSPAQKRGMLLFVELGCGGCHAGPMFSDFELHQLGTDPHPDDPTASPARAVRTPTLRHVAQTAPYMHNGTLGTLREVMEFYQQLSFGEREHADSSDPHIAGLGPITSFERDDIIAFLHALSDGDVDGHVPAMVPSGLMPGGTIP